MLDRTRLAKLLALTTSDNDAEALSAIRKANEIIRGEDLTWAEVVTIDAQPLINIMVQRRTPATGAVDGDDKDWQPPHLSQETIINPMFQAVYSQPRTGNDEFWQWLDSVHQQWTEKKRLTANQYNALRRCYNRTRARSA